MNNPAYSIQFGETVDKGMEQQVIFPYIYNFVSLEDEYILNDTPIGLFVGANSRVQKPIRMDPDYHFLMLWIRYSVFTAPSIVSPSQSFVNPAAPAVWEYDWGDFQTSIGTSFLRDISASVSIHGSDTRYVYGGANNDAQTQGGGAGILPTPIRALQGYEYGIGQVRTPYFVPRSGVIMVTLTNSSDNDYYIHGVIHGVKVRI